MVLACTTWLSYVPVSFEPRGTSRYKPVTLSKTSLRTAKQEGLRIPAWWSLE